MCWCSFRLSFLMSNNTLLFSFPNNTCNVRVKWPRLMLFRLALELIGTHFIVKVSSKLLFWVEYYLTLLLRQPKWITLYNNNIKQVFFPQHF